MQVQKSWEGVGVWDLQNRETAAPKKLGMLIMYTEQRCRVIAYNETGMCDLGRNRLCRGMVFRL